MDLVPLPCAIARRPGFFVLDQGVSLVAAGPATRSAWLLHDLLRPGTGLPLPVAGTDDGSAGAISLRVIPHPHANPESYTVDVGENRVELTASAPAGLAWAVQTFRQLLPPDALRMAPASTSPLAAPCCTIEDEPRFAWRGVLLDVARHFMPKEFLFRMIDLAALHKLNVLHLHLTDDQGWRMEVPSWPRLTEVGAGRRETARGHAAHPTGYDGTPHGGYYTLTDLRELAEYAIRRQVTVLPEIAMPGHVQAALAAYPELGQTGPHPVRADWGSSPHVLAPGVRTCQFITEVLDTAMQVFPGPYIHLGGDECPRAEWRASRHAVEWAGQHGLPSPDALQSWLLRFAAAHVQRYGRGIAAWDQAMEDGGVPPETLIMVWRDWAEKDMSAVALGSGHNVVYCPTRSTYFDHYQSGHPGEPLAFPEQTSLEDVMVFDPAPGDPPLPSAMGSRILGTQAQLWSEHLCTPRDVEYMAFPRLGALAEAAWTAASSRSANALTLRMAGYLARLDALSVGYRPPAGPLVWQEGGHGDRARSTGVR